MRFKVWYRIPMSFFAQTPKVVTNDAKIRELLTRGVERIFPNAEFLEKRLKSGERQTIYLGIDPTGPSLHIGHVIPLLKLRQFQELGHRIILLIGDFTGMIGDPTDKGAARKQLTRAEVLYNARLYKKQASALLKFGGKNPANLRYNSKWLSKLSFRDILGVFSNITYGQMVKRDMFQKRIEEGKDLYLHELLYPVLQGYDSVVLDVDGEVGGNDQTFNMLVGRDLMKKLKNKERFVVALKLLTDSSDKKMGKTEGNMVTLEDTPANIYGKIMSWADAMILPGFELCTVVPLAEIASVKQKLEAGENPKELKMRLAREIVALCRGDEKAREAEESFVTTFQEKKPQAFVEIQLLRNNISDELIGKEVVSSKSELRRLISEGAISNLDTNQKSGEEFLTNPEKGTYRIGKHRFIKIL